MSARCPHCGAKPKEGKASRYGIDKIRGRLDRGDRLKQIAFDLQMDVSQLARWCSARGLRSVRSRHRREAA